MNTSYIVLYGINSVTDLLLKQYPNALLATTTGGENYKERRVYSLDELALKDKQSIEKIIICSMFVDDIANSLIETGFELDKIEFYNITYSQVMRCVDTVKQGNQPEQILHVVYDLSVNLPCFDALSFAAVAEAHRIKLGLKHIHFYVLSPEINNDKFSFSAHYSESERNWRIANIVRPIFESFSSYIGTTNITHREELSHFIGSKKHVFPASILSEGTGKAYGLLKLETYIDDGIPLPELTVPDSAQIMVDKLLQSEEVAGKKLVTLTLRNTMTHPERNSPITPWLEFIESLDKEQFFPIVIRDTSECLSPSALSNIALELPAASVNFHLRIALYNSAYINLSSSGGPSFAYYFLKGCSSIRYSPIDERHFATSKATLERAGFKIGQEQFFAKNGTHQIPYDVETTESICAYFKQQCVILEQQSDDV
ncbi:hypothetical protein [Pseudoalteromonas luteoviolacea]|uniref:Uncharacterized protein n=1 Tax=Pseudoalteromonas luteoviolacea H33 TaxID=1365251 RepID=A0A167C3A8_9GAMM|nr:hypothetical protein [Pseudoalteromonas luteoviolacea]KZN47187.1 hypothetical protein N476_23700 [Pseudoalteromonas luteoviolacea H33]KZN77197.1 hypothetical protein N477_12490 [Pseudoalteromonas luteoviolacea H33-S]MBQ4879350.1 hypothetical protein [Pseudoalteromonas luteoviolacea]MBQ4908410.1 hypothetical protein [Pseudoalteromonas luteoviolacea]